MLGNYFQRANRKKRIYVDLVKNYSENSSAPVSPYLRNAQQEDGVYIPQALDPEFQNSTQDFKQRQYCLKVMLSIK